MDELTLGQTVRSKRLERGLSLRALAVRLGVSAPFLSDVELGRRFPSGPVLARMAAALAVPLEELERADARVPVEELKRLLDRNPRLQAAFAAVIAQVQKGHLNEVDLWRLARKADAKAIKAV